MTTNVTKCFLSGRVLFTFLMAVTKHWAENNFREWRSLLAHSLMGRKFTIVGQEG